MTRQTFSVPTNSPLVTRSRTRLRSFNHDQCLKFLFFFEFVILTRNQLGLLSAWCLFFFMPPFKFPKRHCFAIFFLNIHFLVCHFLFILSVFCFLGFVLQCCVITESSSSLWCGTLGSPLHFFLFFWNFPATSSGETSFFAAPPACSVFPSASSSY